VDDTTHNIENDGFKACFLVLVFLEIRLVLFSLSTRPLPQNAIELSVK
jgi:hypothetical protein